MTAGQGDLWKFSVAVYGAEGVSAACLALQEKCGTDVPVLLYALWLARRGISLDANGMARIEAEVGAWRDEVIQPLRKIRTRMKSGPPPAPGAATDPLRNAIKVSELSAEKIEIGCLAALDWPGGDTDSATCGANLAVAITHYAGEGRVPEAEADLLARAAESIC